VSIQRTVGWVIYWTMLLLAVLIFSMAFQGPAQAVLVDRYDSESRLTRALLECESVNEVDVTDGLGLSITGWCDTAVDPTTDFRGELWWSAWGATLSIHTCWAGTHYDCLEIQSEMDFRFISIGMDNVVKYLRAYDFYTSEDRYFHILNWTETQQQVTGQLEDGRRFILIFTGVTDEKAYLWSD